jgi:hypothetical protein
MKLSSHYTDLAIAGGKKRRRVVSNWCNYAEPGTHLRLSAPGVEVAQSAPAHWDGRFDFSDVSQRAPLQGFFRDATDPDNRALIGCRIAARPGAWLNLKAVDVRPVDAEIEEGGAAVRWRDLWPSCDIVFRPGRHRLDKLIVCREPGHPLTFEFTIRLADGLVLNFRDGGAVVLDERGDVVLRLPAPWARDSSTTALDPEGARVGVTMAEGEPRTLGGHVYRVLRLDLDPEDVARATYPVTVDPSVVIAGTAAIEDNWLRSVAPTQNQGSNSRLYVYAPGRNGDVSILRCLPGYAPPASSVVDARLSLRFNSSHSPIAAFLIQDINASWAELTSCWNLARAGQAWAGGSSGCSVSGVDHVADAEPPSVSVINTSYYTFVLGALRAQSFAASSAGLVIKSLATGTGFTYADSTEATINQPYFEIDYEETPTTSAAHYRRRLLLGG